MHTLGWHIDRKVPLALIAALIVQSLSMVWWAAKLSERVEQLEAHDSANLLMVERMARVEEKIGSLKDAMQRIETKFDRPH